MRFLTLQSLSVSLSLSDSFSRYEQRPACSVAKQTCIVHQMLTPWTNTIARHRWHCCYAWTCSSAAVNTAASDEVLRSGCHAQNSLRLCILAVQPGITTLQSRLSRRQTSRKASCLLDCMRMLTWTSSPSCISAKVVLPFPFGHCFPVATSIGYSPFLMQTGWLCVLDCQGQKGTEDGHAPHSGFLSWALMLTWDVHILPCQHEGKAVSYRQALRVKDTKLFETLPLCWKDS